MIRQTLSGDLARQIHQTLSDLSAPVQKDQTVSDLSGTARRSVACPEVIKGDVGALVALRLCPMSRGKAGGLRGPLTLC